MSKNKNSSKVNIFVVVFFFFLDLLFLALCIYLLLHSPFLPFELERSEGNCPWTVTKTKIHFNQGECVYFINGVKLDEYSLTREPVYLPNRKVLKQWIHSQEQLYSDLHNKSSTTIGIGTEESVRTIEVSIIKRSWSWAFARFLPLTIASLLMFLISAFVYYRKPKQLPSKLFFLLAQGQIISAFITALNTHRGISLPSFSNVIFLQINLAALLVASFSFTALSLVFPKPFSNRRIQKIGLVGLLFLGGITILAESIGFFGISLTVMAPILLVAVILFFVSLIRPMNQIQRAQSLWFFWGFILLAILFLILRLPIILGIETTSDVTDEYWLLVSLPIPIGIAISILRYRLLEINVVFRRTIIGSIAVIVVIFLYYLIVSTFASGMAETQIPGSSFVTIFISAAVLAFIVFPVQNWLEDILDRYFYRNRHNYRKILTRVPDDLALINSPNEVAEHVLDQISKSMEVPRIVISIVPGNWIEKKWTKSPPDVDIEVPNSTGFWSEIKEIADNLLLDPQENQGTVFEWMKKQGFELVFPLRTEDDLVGLMACSIPIGRKLLSAEDISILRTVASSLALSLSRSHVYADLQKINEELEDRIEKRTKELQDVRLRLFQWEKMASLGVLAAGVAHELNSPLEVVLSTTDQVLRFFNKNEEPNSRNVRLANLCKNSARKAANIVNDLRKFSRPESKKIELMNIHDQINAALNILTEKFEQKNITVEKELEPVPSVEGYAALVNQALTNLVLNAIEAVDEEGNIRVITRKIGEEKIHIIVEDDGPGIPEDKRTRVFEPFYTTKSPGKGTGLGLSLSYTFISQHGGVVFVDEKESKGARFVIELPIKIPEELRMPPKTGQTS